MNTIPDVVEYLCKRGIVDKQKYSTDQKYRESSETLAARIIARSGLKYERLIDMIILESKSRAPEGISFDLYSILEAIDENSDKWNWREIHRLDKELGGKEHQVEGPLRMVIRSTRKMTTDRGLTLLGFYAVLSILMTPVASYLLAILTQFADKNGTAFSLNSDFGDIVKGVVSAALVLPLVITNKFLKTIRRPVFNPVFAPALLVLGLLLAIEYLYALHYFLAPGAISLKVFLIYLLSATKQRWLFPLPFAVILLNLIIYSRFVYISQGAAEFFNDPDGPGGYIKFAITAGVAIIISLAIRLIAFVVANAL